VKITFRTESNYYPSLQKYIAYAGYKNLIMYHIIKHYQKVERP